MEKEGSNDNGKEATLELNDESSFEGSETTEVDVVSSTGINRNILEEDRFRSLIGNCT